MVLLLFSLFLQLTEFALMPSGAETKLLYPVDNTIGAVRVLIGCLLGNPTAQSSWLERDRFPNSMLKNMAKCLSPATVLWK